MSAAERRYGLWSWARVLGLAVVLGACLAPWIGADRWFVGLALLYAPRVLVAAGALVLALLFWWERRRGLAGLACLGMAGLVLQLGWGSGASELASDGARVLSVLSYNAHHNEHGAPIVARLVREQAVDVVCLQELQPKERAPFVAALSDFQVFVPDESLTFERSDFGPFSSLIAVRRSLLSGAETAVEVETALTGYRTFAARLPLEGGLLWVVNVHTTKPMWWRAGPLGIVLRSIDNLRMHAAEGRRLEDWVLAHAEQAVLLAGDFNAPLGAMAVKIPGTTVAHLSAGSGWHRTFPAWLPSWGLDHVLGNEHLRFHSYETLDPGTSDHLAQLARFSIRP